MKDNEIIYQIFPRNYSYSSPFLSIKNDLKRIKDLGVTIIYLMPIHEIGIKNRKGTYGSPYSIKDYFSISKDLGSKEEFLSLIKEIHKEDMKIILDMVFNHTAKDNNLINEHEEYYYHKDNKLCNRVSDWSDITDLDTFKEDTQEYLISVLKYYVDLGVDGFRFDVASLIDINLFKKARERFNKDIIFVGESIDKGFMKYIKENNIPVNEDDDLYPTFSSLYNYNYFRQMISYFKGEGKLIDIIEEINNDKNNLRLLCLENHDNDRIASILSINNLKKWLNFFSFIKGQIFIYAGQEYGYKHKVELFEKDVIDWSNKDENYLSIYKEYILNKKRQKKIIDQYIELIDDHNVKVNVKYFDGSEENKIFDLSID